MRHFMKPNSNGCLRTKNHISKRNNERIQQLLRVITHSRYSILGRIDSLVKLIPFTMLSVLQVSVYFTCLDQAMFLTLIF